MADAAEDPAVRVGDDERRAVDAVLQRAHGEGRLTLAEYEERAADAWAARTRGDLAALTADLPASTAPAVRAPVAVEPAGPGRPRRGAGLLGAVVVAGVALWGGGQLVSSADGASVFSSRTVPVAPGADRVEVGVLFGSTDVVVPDDARVVLDGTMVFGSVDCDAACSGTGTRTVTVDASGAFGSVDVRTASEAAADRADRDDDRDDGDDGRDDD